MDSEETKTGKKYWPSKWVFILAAIGSAAGLGNLWRFPFLAYDHGGAAFVLALVVAYLLIGIPLLMMEVGLGQLTQKGAADAFGSIKKKFRHVGWIALLISFLVITYYMVVLSWGLNYVTLSFDLGWGSDTGAHFFENVLNLSSGVGDIGGFSIPVLIGLAVAWVLVYFSVWKGVDSISKVIKWTATAPFVILIILIARSVTLEGAGEGLSLLFLPDWSALLSTELWLGAFSQVFFSLSLAFGIMIAYGSLRRKKEEVTKSALLIAGGNFLVSIMSGLVVFGTLGYMAMQQGVPVSDVVEGGPSLAFVVFPKAINLLPAFAEVIAVLFFLTFLTLAMDSAFSLVEVLATTIRDRFPHINYSKVALAISSAGFLLGLVFATQAGLYFLDIMDHFLVNYGLVIVGILETVVVGWLWKGNHLREFINERSGWKLGKWWDISIKYITPIFLTVLLAVNIYREFQNPYEGYPTWALLTIGVLPVVLIPFVGVILDKLTESREEV